MSKRLRYLVSVGAAMVLVALVVRYAIQSDDFVPIDFCHRLLFERPQRHPPDGIWQNKNAVAEPAAFRLPGGDMFFAEDSGMDSLFLELHSNATYQITARMHVGCMLWDKGKWHFTETGDIIMQSDIRYQSLYSDDHWYVSMDGNRLADLPEIKTGIRDFLDRNPSNLFSFAAVADIRLNSVKHGTNLTLSVFSGYGWKLVKRESLEKFLGQIDDYLAWPEKNVFRFHPITYKSYVFLVNLDSRYLSPEKQMSDIKKKVDRLKGNQVPSCMYVQLTREMFEAETGRSEPFKFTR
jgi:hypothetical protein